MQHTQAASRNMLISSFLLGFAMFAPMANIPPLEHILKEELLITHTQTGLLFSTPFIMLVALSIPGGLLADRVGARRIAGIGAILIMIGSILRGTATDFSSLLAFTLIYGVGVGLAFPNLPKLISIWLPREKAGVASGIFIGGLTVGTALPLSITVPVIYPVTNTFQGTFFFWSIPAILAAVLWWILVKDPPYKSMPEEQASQRNVPFRSLLQNKNLWLVSIVLLLNNSFMFTWIGWTPALMIQKGATPDLAALIASISMWVAIPSVFLMPQLSYKLGVRKPFVWIPSFVLALVALSAIFTGVSMGWVLMTVVGIFNSARFVTLMALPIELISKEAVGAASGLMLSIGYAGSIIGPLIGGHLFDITGSLDSTLIALIGVAVATGVLSLKIPETGTRPISKK